MSVPSNSARASFPMLTSWVASAPEANIWKEMLADATGGRDFLLAPMERIAEVLESNPPNRLATKLKHLRNDLDLSNQLNLRVELLVAHLLVQAGMTVEFGGTGEPDIRCSGTTHPAVWLEITTRDRDDTARLRSELEVALAGAAVNVDLRLQRRMLIIPERDRVAISERILAQVRGIGCGFRTVSLPEIQGVAECQGICPPEPGGVVLSLGADLTGQAASIERELQNVIRIKTGQARRGGFDPLTLLVVDASRLGLAWVRPEWVWEQVLSSVELSWDSIPYVGLVVAFTSMESVRVSGAWILRPGASSQDQNAVLPVLHALGL